MSSNTETATVLQGGVAASLVPACTFFPPPHHCLGQLTPGRECLWLEVTKWQDLGCRPLPGFGGTLF